jgi:hypothetical protein
VTPVDRTHDSPEAYRVRERRPREVDLIVLHQTGTPRPVNPAAPGLDRVKAHALVLDSGEVRQLHPWLARLRYGSGVPVWCRTIMREAAFPPPLPLRQLAEITDFNLYVSMTFDPLLEQAVTEQDEPVADPVAEAFKAAVMAVLDDASLDLAGKMAKIETILEQQEALAPAPAAPAAPAQEQTLAEQVKRLTEQVATLTKAPKPKKYITAPVPEQTDTVPTALTDKAKMRKWLTS